MIRGLSIGDGTGTPQKVYLEVDSDKNCYVVLPNGTLLTSTSGVINYDYTGVAGNVKLIVPKDTAIIKTSEAGVGGSAFHGDLKIETSCALYELGYSEYMTIDVNNATDRVIAPSNLFLYSFKCDEAKEVDFSYCACTAQSIGLFLAAAATYNPNYAGDANFSGGDNALKADVATFMFNSGLLTPNSVAALNLWIATYLPNWTIQIDTTRP